MGETIGGAEYDFPFWSNRVNADDSYGSMRNHASVVPCHGFEDRPVWNDREEPNNAPQVGVSLGVWTLTSRRLREIGTVELRELASQSLSLGSESADVMLDWPGVARRHVTLSQVDDQLLLEVHAAKTWLNEAPVAVGENVRLKASDKLTIGPIELHVGWEAAAEQPEADGQVPDVDTDEWIERAEVQSELRRQLDEVELAAEEQQQRLAEAEAAVEATIDEAGRDPSGRNLEEDIDRYRELIDELKLSLVARTGEALEAHRQRLRDLQRRQSELDELRSRVKSRSDALGSREHTVHEREEAVSRAEDAVAEREQDLAGSAEAISDRARELDEKEQSCWRREREIERQEAEISRHETTWQTRLAEVQAQQLELEQSHAAAARIEDEWRSRGAELDVRDKAAREREESIAEREAEQETRARQLEERAAAIEEERQTNRTEHEAIEAERKRLEDIRHEIDERRETLDQTAIDIGEQKAELARQQAALAQEKERQSAALSRREVDVVSRESYVEEREVDLRNRELAIELSREEFDATSSSHALSSDEVATQASQLSTREAELASLEEAAKSRLAEADSIRAEAEAERASLDEKLQHQRTAEATIEEAERAVELRVAEAERVEAELKVERDRLTALQSEIDDRETAAQSAQDPFEGVDPSVEFVEEQQPDADLESLRAELESLRSELQVEREAIESDRVELEQARESIDSLKTQLDADRTAVAAVQDEVQTLQTELAAERESIEQRQSELVDREAELQDREQSLKTIEEPTSDVSDVDSQPVDVDALRAEVELEKAELAAERQRLEKLADEIESRSITMIPETADESHVEEHDAERGLIAEWTARQAASDSQVVDAIDPSTIPAGRVADDELESAAPSAIPPVEPIDESAIFAAPAEAPSEPQAADPMDEAENSAKADTTWSDEATSIAATSNHEAPQQSSTWEDVKESTYDPFGDEPGETKLTSSDDGFAELSPSETDAGVASANPFDEPFKTSSNAFDSSEPVEEAPRPIVDELDTAEASDQAENLFEDASVDAASGSPFDEPAETELHRSQPVPTDGDPFASDTVSDEPEPADTFADGHSGSEAHSSPDPFSAETPSETSDPFGDTSLGSEDPFGTVDVRDVATPDVSESQLGIRSQLADMFGVSMSELASASSPEGSPSTTSDVGPDDPDEPDIRPEVGDDPFKSPQDDSEPVADSPWLESDPIASDEAESASETENKEANNPFGDQPSDASSLGDVSAEASEATDLEFSTESILERFKAQCAAENAAAENSTAENSTAENSTAENSTAENSTAEQQPVTEPEPPVAVEPTPPPAPEPETAQEPDSVAAYMEQLLARSRGAAEPAAKPAEVKAAPRKVVVEEAQEEAEPTPPPKERQPVDADKIRKETVSFREVALASSRSAVAKSRIKQIRMQVIAKGCACVIGGAVTTILLASPLWSNESYVLFGVAAALITIALGYFALESFRSYSQVLGLSSGPSPEPALASEEVAQPTE